MTRIAIRPIAERDIADALAWYDQQSAGSGDVFLERLGLLFDLIAQRPTGFRAMHGGLRRALMRRFPYTVYDRDEADGIVVFAVYHQRRDPMQLAERLKE